MASRNLNLSWYRETDMLYKYVIDTVMQECKEHFLDEGLSEDVLLDLKATWEQHVEHNQVTFNYPPPRPKPNHASSSHALHEAFQPIAPQDLKQEEREEVKVEIAPAEEAGNGEENHVDEEELTSEDDEPLSEEATALFDTDNTLVCQYEKIMKSKNKWKFFLKSGIMTVNEKDYVFHKCAGEATW